MRSELRWHELWSPDGVGGIEDKLQTPAEMEESNFTRQLAQELLAELAGRSSVSASPKVKSIR